MRFKALTLSLLTGSILFSGLPLVPMAQAASGPAFVTEYKGIQEYKLSNGLKVLLVENHSAPVVSVNIVYHVGSRNEAVGYTGSTHFLEHMLFKGTPKFNKAKGTQIANLLLKHGAKSNATTWLDRTNYFETLPASQLDLALDIESDRMRNSFIKDADRKSEMSVVRNELERGENNPGRIMWLNLLANAFTAHPYHHPTIGWRSDVEGLPTERLKKFYQDFYYPNNATLIVVGDFQTKNAIQKIQSKFGHIKGSDKPIPKVYTQEPAQQGERRFTINRPGQLGIVNMGFHVPPKESNDSYALYVLENILSSGVSSRLNQALVEKQLSVSTYAFNMQLRDPGLFVINTKMASGADHNEVEKAIYNVIDTLKTKLVDNDELKRVKSMMKANFVFENHGTHALASSLSEFEASADWRYMASYLDQVLKVTPEDIQRVVKKYFIPSNRTVGYFVPKKVKEVDTTAGTFSYAKMSSNRKSTSSVKKGKVERVNFGKNGRMIVLENHLDKTVAIKGTLYAGSINDPKGKSGLAQLTASMLDQGTKKNSKLSLAKKLEAMGSKMSFSANQERMQFSGASLSENLNETLALLDEVIKMPSFPEAEFKKTKSRLLDGFKQRLEDTNQQAWETLKGQLYPKGHPHHQNTQALIKDFETLTLQDVRTFYKRHYGANKMIISFVGDVKTPVLKKWTQSAFGTWKNNNETRVDIPNIAMQSKGEKSIHLMKDKANVTINMGVQSNINMGHPDYFPATIANHALGRSTLSSRLGLKVRDELGLTYGIYSYFARVNKGSGPWLLSVSTAPKNVDKTIQAAMGVIDKYRKEGITQKEFDVAKLSTIGSFLVRLTTNPEIANRLDYIEFYGLGDNYITDRAKQVEKVTLNQVNQMIKKYFDTQRLSISIAGNYKGK